MKPDEIRSRLQRVANGESGRARFPRQRHPAPNATGRPSRDLVVPLSTGEASSAAETINAANPGHPAAPSAPGAGAAAGRAGGAGSTGTPPPVGSPKGNGHGGHDDRAYAWNRAPTPGANGDPEADPIAGDAAADAADAVESYRRDGRPIEWRNPNGGIVRSTSGTKEAIESPPAHRARRWAVPIAAVVVVLAGATIFAVRQFGHSPPAGQHAITTPGPTHPPGSVAPSGSESSSGVRPLANVKWLCDEQRPADSVVLPITQTTYNGHAAYPSFTWFMFSTDFPIALPSGFQIAYSPTTACLYDSTSPARMIGIDKWTPSGTASWRRESGWARWGLARSAPSPTST